MPAILVSEKATKIILEIVDYDKDEEDVLSWCDIKIEIVNEFFNYSKIGEFLLSTEVDYLIRWLTNAINNSLTDEEELEFTEPELFFKFNKSSFEKQYLEFELNYSSNESRTLSFSPKRKNLVNAFLDIEKSSFTLESSSK